MKVLKVFVLIVLLLFGAWSLLCIIAPSSMESEVRKEMQAEPELVYSLIADLRYWDLWSPWSDSDSLVTFTLTHPSAGVGAEMLWDGPQAGKGRMVITETRRPSYLRSELFFNAWDSRFEMAFQLEELDARTLVTWKMTSEKIPFLLRGFLVMMNGSEAIGRDFERGLEALKNESENRQTYLDASRVLEVPEPGFPLLEEAE